MLNVLIADDNIYYVKNLVNFVIGKNSNIKITNIASDGLEVLNVIQENSDKIDLILLDLKMPKIDGIEILDKLYNMNLAHSPTVFVISGESYLLSQVIHHPLVSDFINKFENMDNIYNKLQNYERNLNFLKQKENLSKKIYSELVHIGYNPSHIGTQYIKECILEIYSNSNNTYTQNLENFIYKKIAFSHNKSLKNVKTNIVKATDYMYTEADMSKIKDYFCFNDINKKPTPKVVISTILNKL